MSLPSPIIHPNASRSGLSRCLRRHGVSNLKALLSEEEKDSSPKKTFKDYEPGFKYLPRMPDEERHGYLFAAIDRATRWVYIEILKDCHLLPQETSQKGPISDCEGLDRQR